MTGRRLVWGWKKIPPPHKMGPRLKPPEKVTTQKDRMTLTTANAEPSLTNLLRDKLKNFRSVEKYAKLDGSAIRAGLERLRGRGDE